MSKDNAIKFFIDLMSVTGGVNQSEIANKLKITKSSYTQYLNSNFGSLLRFIVIAELCGFSIHLVNKKKNMNIDMTEMLKDNKQ